VIHQFYRYDDPQRLKELKETMQYLLSRVEAREFWIVEVNKNRSSAPSQQIENSHIDRESIVSSVSNVSSARGNI
jgi:hypothetical protein